MGPLWGSCKEGTQVSFCLATASRLCGLNALLYGVPSSLLLVCVWPCRCPWFPDPPAARRRTVAWKQRMHCPLCCHCRWNSWRSAEVSTVREFLEIMIGFECITAEQETMLPMGPEVSAHRHSIPFGWCQALPAGTVTRHAQTGANGRSLFAKTSCCFGDTCNGDSGDGCRVHVVASASRFPNVVAPLCPTFVPANTARQSLAAHLHRMRRHVEKDRCSRLD